MHISYFNSSSFFLQCTKKAIKFARLLGEFMRHNKISILNLHCFLRFHYQQYFIFSLVVESENSNLKKRIQQIMDKVINSKITIQSNFEQIKWPTKNINAILLNQPRY